MSVKPYHINNDFNINGLNTPSARQRLKKWVKNVVQQYDE